MSDTKFTPGPWFVNGAGNISVGHTPSCRMNNGCATDCCTTMAVMIDNDANAALIAAAPDLYEALVAFLSPEFEAANRTIEEGPGGTVAEDRAHEFIVSVEVKAAAALAKANGEGV